MYVFVDDSGDPGFKFGQGSSNFLVIACCVFETAATVEKAANHVLGKKKQLNSNHEFELKFHKSRFDTKINFLKSLEHLEFYVSAVVVDKRKIPKTTHLSMKMLILALEQLDTLYAPAKVTIDGVMPRKNALATATSIRKNLTTSKIVIDSIRFRDSKIDPLIQLADFIAGSLRTTYEYADSDSKEIARALESITKHSKTRVHLLNS